MSFLDNLFHDPKYQTTDPRKPEEIENDAEIIISYAAPRPGDVKDSQADIGKAKTLLGYTPTVPFEVGLEKTVAWYRASVPA